MGWVYVRHGDLGLRNLHVAHYVDLTTWCHLGHMFVKFVAAMDVCNGHLIKCDGHACWILPLASIGNVENVPSTRGKHFICSTCKNHIYNGNVPPMSHKNNLEVFEFEKYPELLLTESVVTTFILFNCIKQLDCL